MSRLPTPPPDREGPAPRPDPETETLSDLLGDLAGRPDEGNRLSRLRVRAVGAAERATTWGPVGPLAEVGWRAYRRDQAIAGSVLASAIAYRLFIWILPLTLVLTAALGLVATGDGEAGQVLEDAGIGSVVADSIGEATQTSSLLARVAVIVSGLVVLLYETYVLLRALRATSAFAWRVPVRPMRRPARRSAALLGILLAAFAAGAVTKALAHTTDAPVGWIVALAALAIWPCAFLAMSIWLLPSAARGWTAHLPGALVFSALAVGIHLFNLLILLPYIARKEETYGVLGLAAGVLLSLFVMSRALAVCSALNAILHEDRQRPPAPG